MKDANHQELSRDSSLTEAERTLRLIATLPAPDGLEDRLQAALTTAPRKARILSWPAAHTPAAGWLRTAAAAAIVFVVAGGGWGVYTRVQPAPSAKVIVMPPRAQAPGSFSNAGAMRTPTTLNGPAVAQPATVRQSPVKATAQNTPKQNRRPRSTTASKAAPQVGQK
jgi:hypothetical protein